VHSSNCVRGAFPQVYQDICSTINRRTETHPFSLSKIRGALAEKKTNTGTFRSISLLGRKRKKEEERGRKRKKEEERGRKRKKEEERGRKRKKEEERGRKRKKEEERGRKRKKEEERGRKRKKEE
jgi:hypothetical protein